MNDVIFEDFIALRYIKPNQHDLVRYADEDSTSIMWIVGLPNDSIVSRDGKIWVNQVPVDKAYAQLPEGAVIKPFVVPPDRYFVVGKVFTKKQSTRLSGQLVAPEKIRSRLVWRIFPPARFGPIQ